MLALQCSAHILL